MKALNRQRADEDGPVTYSNTSGRFVTVDICGTMGLWNTDMQLQKSVVVSNINVTTPDTSVVGYFFYFHDDYMKICPNHNLLTSLKSWMR